MPTPRARKAPKAPKTTTVPRTVLLGDAWARTGTATIPALPPGVHVADLRYPGVAHQARDGHTPLQFDLWHTTTGWCIATLLISRSKSRGASSYSGGERTYAVTLHGQTVSIGNGPHVTCRVTVYVRHDRREALASYLALHAAGARRAHEIRDRISTRRALRAM